MQIEVTDIKFRKLFDTEPLKAVCSITLNEAIAIHDIKLVRAGNRTILVMPSRKRADGEFVDIIHPINSQSRRIIEEAVVNEYDRLRENTKLSSEF